MSLPLKLRKYASLIAKNGVNVQNGQNVVIRASVDNAEFVHMLVEECYLAKAKKVQVDWIDQHLTKLHYTYQSEETLCEVKDYYVEEQKDIYENLSAMISITSPIPGIMSGVDTRKIALRNKAYSQALEPYHKYIAANLTQWCVAAASNPVWAKKVFPQLDADKANEKLWDAILTSCHVDDDNDPNKAWEIHNQEFASRIDILNHCNFDKLHFVSELGTDLYVGLVKNHIWAGGYELTQKSNIIFNPNMPTEEIFTMPDRLSVNGKVVASKPLDYGGNLIENFWFEFKDGKVVDYGAEKNQDSLKELIEFDKGSAYLGEVALVPYHSPISEMNLLFYNTLFDENASCHLALGACYPTNVKNGENMSKEELLEAGGNDSMEHVDFMFGTKNMHVKGIDKDGKEKDVFVNGDFVI